MAFYVYRHIRLDSNTPFYVGKGMGSRAFNFKGRNRYWTSIFNKTSIKVEILAYFESESDAYKYEEKLINLYKKYNLCEANLVLRGKGGCAGVIFSLERRLKHGKSTRKRLRKGHHNSKELVCVETGSVFRDSAAAARELGLIQGHINKVCHGIRKSHGGFTFKFTKVG